MSHRPHRLAASALLALLLCSARAGVRADPPPSPDARDLDAELVTAHRRADALLFAATARAIPEARLAALITAPDAPMPARLAAAHAAAHADDPVVLLASLARVMREGDPELAPAAAMALTELLATRVEPGRREHTAREVRAALGPALAVAGDEDARSDLRAASEALAGFVQRMERGW